MEAQHHQNMHGPPNEVYVPLQQPYYQRGRMETDKRSSHRGMIRALQQHTRINNNDTYFENDDSYGIPPSVMYGDGDHHTLSDFTSHVDKNYGGDDYTYS
jgi:hypothetical protein